MQSKRNENKSNKSQVTSYSKWRIYMYIICIYTIETIYIYMNQLMQSQRNAKAF